MRFLREYHHVSLVGLMRTVSEEACIMSPRCFSCTEVFNFVSILFQMFFCISLGFVIAWAPYAIVSFLFIFHKGNWYMAPKGFVFPALFAKSSHIYNPFIYFYFNKTFQREFRYLLFILWPRWGGNRVGIHFATGQQNPFPIHIQLQERGSVPKKKKKKESLSQDRIHSRSRNKDKAWKTDSNHLGMRPVVTCWDFSSNAQPISENQPAKNPVSI